MGIQKRTETTRHWWGKDTSVTIKDNGDVVISRPALKQGIEGTVLEEGKSITLPFNQAMEIKDLLNEVYKDLNA